MSKRKYESLKVVTDKEADQLLSAWKEWAARCGHAVPFTTTLTHDITLLATAFSSAFVAGTMHLEFEEGKVKLQSEGH